MRKKHGIEPEDSPKSRKTKKTKKALQVESDDDDLSLSKLEEISVESQ